MLGELSLEELVMEEENFPEGSAGLSMIQGSFLRNRNKI